MNIKNNHTNDITVRVLLPIVGLVFFVFLVGYLYSAYRTEYAYAATPPDSCFSVSGTTIDDYSSAPECPRDVDIPSVIYGQTIDTIANYAFAWSSLTSVTIPSSVDHIGWGAFSDNSITSVAIPSSVTFLGGASFKGNSLTSIALPDSLTGIEEETFSSNLLTSVTIPSSVTFIGNYAFSSNSLESVTLPSSLTSIGVSAFANNSLATLTVPSSVSTVGGGAFSRNALTSVSLAGNPGSIGGTAFTYQGVEFNAMNIPSFDNSLVTFIHAPHYTGTDLATRVFFDGGDENQNGDTTDIISAQILNPTPLTLHFTTSSGTVLRESITYYGPQLTSQSVHALHTLAPDVSSATLGDYYYTADSAITLSHPDITGHLPVGDDQTIQTVAGEDNTITFLYVAQEDTDDTGPGGATPTLPTQPTDLDDATDSVDTNLADTSSPDTPGAPNSGVGSVSGIIGVLGVVILGVAGVGVASRRL